jgi:hypothetical protein
MLLQISVTLFLFAVAFIVTAKITSVALDLLSTITVEVFRLVGNILDTLWRTK